DSDCPDSVTQRLPVKAVPADAPLNATSGRNPAYLESIEYLKGAMQNPSQFDIDMESDGATPQSATVASQAGALTSSYMDFVMDLANDYVDSQMEAVAAEVMQEGAESEGIQRTESDASSENQLPPEDDEESEAVEQRQAKRHSCHYCGHSTARRHDLVRHMRTHTGSKPYQCELCEYSANHPSHIATHRRIHTKEKPYACERCEYRSATSSDLIVHRRKHTGEKPYACSYGDCLYRSTHHGNLARHIRRNH
ncbi:zinc finger protein, partial [Aphelenchoides avenae]